MYACTHPRWPTEREEDLLSHHDCGYHLQVLYFFSLKFLHVIFKACGGPQTLNFGFLEGRFKLESHCYQLHTGQAEKHIPVTDARVKEKQHKNTALCLLQGTNQKELEYDFYHHSV